MSNHSQTIFESFTKLLDKLVEGKIYDTLPPKGPIDDDNVFVSNEELDALDQDLFGERNRNDIKSNSKPYEIKVVENYKRIKVEWPSTELLNGINIIGISGDNKRIITPSFHLILSRSSIVDFKYTKGYEKPYFYTKSRDVSSILVIDNNIFEDGFKIFTYNGLSMEGSGRVPLLKHIKKFDGKPFRFDYTSDRIKSSPAAHSLGLAVKLQHTLELESISDVDFDNKETVICIKDGPYLSNSVVPTDVKNGLQKLWSWSRKKRFFIAISNKISESKVLINTIKSGHEYLLEEYFPRQNILPDTLESFGTDLLFLRKIISPGFRTPLIQYVETTRASYFEDDTMKGLQPLTCYYHKYTKPYNFIRIEIPRFMWEEDKDFAEFAISVAIWQHELGGDLPLVLKAAAERASLEHDRYVTDQQLKAAFEQKELGLIEFLNNA